MSARSEETLRQGFVKGVVITVAVFIALAGIVQVFNAGHHRPEGVAEDWLASVGDTTRKGVREQSREDAEKIGPVALARPLLAAAGETDGKRAFTDLEVGKATKVGAAARVPFKLHVFADDAERDGTVVLVKQGEDWRVVGLVPRGPSEKVPSEGGAPPSSAPNILWVGALAAGFGLTALASLAVRLATPAP